MGNSASVSTSSYTQILQALQAPECIDGPYIAVGLKHVSDTSSACPVWLFGEQHESEFVDRQCRTLTVVLRQVLCCETAMSSAVTSDGMHKCRTPVKVYVEIAPNVPIRHRYGTPRQRMQGEHTIPHASSRIIQQIYQTMHDLQDVCSTDTFVKADFIEKARDVIIDSEPQNLLDIYDCFYDAAKILHRMGGLYRHDNILAPFDNVQPGQQLSIFMKTVACYARNHLNKYMYKLFMKSIQSWVDRESTLLNVHISDDLLQERADNLVQCFFEVMAQLVDAMAVGHMMQQKDKLLVGYWGAAHIKNQVNYLEQCGYAVNHAFGDTNNINASSFRI